MTANQLKFNWPLIGHKNIVDFLQKSIANDKLAHAYIFYGPEHIGKTTLAENFIASLLCQGNSGQIPCGNCLHCQQFSKGIHSDVYIIDKEEDKKNISIEQIRNLQHNLNMRSFLNSYKIALIRNAECLNKESFNAFLKTLEEPAEKTIIIMLAQNINYFPKTILSRCQVFKLLPVPADEIADYLVKEQKLDKEQAQNLAHLSLGRPGMALEFFREPETLENYKEEIGEFIAIIKGDLAEKLRAVDGILKGLNFLESAEALRKKLSLWRMIVRDLILINSNSDEFIINDFSKKELESLAGRFSLRRLANISVKMEETLKYLNQNATPRLAVENLLMSFDI